MDNADKTMHEALRFAQSPAGQQLLQLLVQTGGKDVQQAMEQAAAGDLTQAKKLLTILLQNPQTRQLLLQFGGNHGPDGR